MNVNWNITKSNGLTISHYAFANANKLREGIRETKTVQFVVFPCTKTSLNIEISCSQKNEGHNFLVGYIPAGAEKFTFHKRTTCGIFDGVPHTRYHFKLTKKQGLPELKEYLSLVLKDYVPDVEKLDADILLYHIDIPEN